MTSRRKKSTKRRTGRLVRGNDGLPTREVGAWSREKLHYIEGYINIFTGGMKDKWPRRVYIDLFAGPGRSVVEGTSEELAGSPLLALAARDAFTQLYFNDSQSPAVAALAKRANAVRQTGVLIRNLDCDEAARDAGAALRLDARNTIGLAVVDPTGFQISLDALRDMTSKRKVDLIITFMTSYLRRFLGRPSLERQLDAFFGSTDWRELLAMREAGRVVTYERLLAFYKHRLATIGYLHVNDTVSIHNSRDVPIYHLVFASKHERGDEFYRKISRRKFTGQARLFE